MQQLLRNVFFTALSIGGTKS